MGCLLCMSLFTNHGSSSVYVRPESGCLIRLTETVFVTRVTGRPESGCLIRLSGMMRCVMMMMMMMMRRKCGETS